MAKFRKDSFIKNQQILDGVFLDINKLPNIKRTLSDEQYAIDPAYNERPDLLASALYSNSRLWWVFALRNPDVLVDPINDFVEGTVIQLPSGNTVKKIAGL